MSNELVGIVLNENELEGTIQDNQLYLNVNILETGASTYESWLGLGNSGSEEDFLLSLKGDKGEQGYSIQYIWDGTKLGLKTENEIEYTFVELKGSIGEQGIQGIQGKGLEFIWNGTQLGVRVQGDLNYTYVDLKGEQGLAGNDGYTPIKDIDYFDGEQGIQGYSAYEVWLNQGNTGTEEDFLLSLKGDKGETGTTSWDGITDKPLAFNPSVHNHNDLYYTEDELNALLSEKANLNHTHTISEVTNLQTTLDGKSNIIHNHTIANITGLQNELDSKETPVGATTKATTAETNAKNYTDVKIAELIDSSPETLNTLNELSQALGNDANFSTTILTEIGSKETPAGSQAKVDAHANLINNPHNVTKSQVGLDSVDNTSDLNKPISTATQMALDNKAESNHTHTELHSHDNKTVIDKFSEVDGKPYYNNAEIGGAVPNLTLTELTLGGRYKILYNDIQDSLDIEVV